MNSGNFLDAMEAIQDQYLISAQRRLDRASEQNKPGGRSVKRIFTVALAAALALLCTIAAAMAVSPPFRAAVISLFQLGEAEQVPGIPAGVNEVRQITIGDTVTAQYLKVEGTWDWITEANGALLRNGAWNAKGSRFYELEGETLTQVGADAPTASAQISRDGREYYALFRYFVYDGALYTDDLSGTLFNGEASLTLPPERIGGRTDVIQLTTQFAGSDEFYEGIYSWVYDLESGEVIDVLEGCGVEQLGRLHAVTLAEDLKHAIVQAGDTWEGTPYLADLENKTLTPLSELFGVEIKEWQFQTAEDGGYRAAFCDSDTILLTTVAGHSAWTYHIPTGALVCTVEDTTGLRLIDSWRSMLALSVDEAGGVSIVDLSTGGRIKLEGVSGNEEFVCKANSTDTKLLWAEWSGSDEYHPRTTINRLGVIDLETGEFTAFDRVRQEELRGEWVYWLGDNRVMILDDLHSKDGYDPDRTPEYYLCVYEF